MDLASYSDFTSDYSRDSFSFVAQTPDSILLTNSDSARFEYLPFNSSNFELYSPYRGDDWSDAVYLGNNLVAGGVYSLDPESVISTNAIKFICAYLKNGSQFV